MNMPKRMARKYRSVLSDKDMVLSFVLSLGMFAASLVVNFVCGTYATDHVSNYVTDIVLSNIPVFDVDIYFVYGAVILVAVIVFLCFAHPHRTPFILKTVSLFVIIRSVFISLTHLGPFPNQVPIDTVNVISKFSFGGDLFFSGHTGLPFLMALIFWHERRLRIFFLLTSLFFAIIVLLGHLHYSIDVLSAFFITYSIFVMAKYFFKKDLVLAEKFGGLVVDA